MLIFAVIFLTIAILPAAVCAEDLGPLSTKGTRQCGINVGYGYSFSSNDDIRFASVYPYFGKVLTDPVGSGMLRGTFEGIVEGAFSYVFKDQSTYATGVNVIGRYNFIPDSNKWRPYIQAVLGMVVTNLSMYHFGSNFNFCSGGAAGLQYFFNDRDSINLECRFTHMSNAGIDSDNSGLNMNNILIGYSHTF